LNDLLGASVIVNGKVVAWFADFNEEAREWCTENHFGEWLVWRATPPVIVPLTDAEYDKSMEETAKLAKVFESTPEAPNGEITCETK